MLRFFDTFRELNMWTILFRLLLTAICGGLIGMDRTRKRHPVGLRTHILICMGAAVTTMTSQYLFRELNMYTDVARLGAQVVSGIGFIGAGTIIVTKQQRIKGLTTAAGLWTAAILGLCFGIGFYEGGLLGCIMVLFIEIVLTRVENRFLDEAPEVNLYVEYLNRGVLEQVLHVFREEGVNVINMDLSQKNPEKKRTSFALFTLRLKNKEMAAELAKTLQKMEHVISVEEF